MSLDHARRMMDAYVTYYNDVRLHSAIGYVAPRAKLEGRDQAIWKKRRENLAEARAKRDQANQAETLLNKGLEALADQPVAAAS